MANQSFIDQKIEALKEIRHFRYSAGVISAEAQIEPLLEMMWGNLG